MKFKILSGNMLKIIAAIFMVIDHVGLMFFPSLKILRILGRLSFPIFAFMISEGARYTRNKLKYFSMLAALATVCQIVYYVAMRSLYMCILVSFSISVLLIYLLQYVKRKIFDKETKTYVKILLSLSFFVALAAVYGICTKGFTKATGISIDYGFFGITVPLFASLFDFRGIDVPESIARLDSLYIRIACIAIALLLLTFDLKNGIQGYSLLTLPLLLLYSEKRGAVNMKYFFYVFYPLHLAALEGIYMLLLRLR